MSLKKIVVLGAGRSSRHVISHLKQVAVQEGFEVVVADADISHISQLIPANDRLSYVQGNAGDSSFRLALMQGSQLVISMLPAFMHIDVVQDCLELEIDIITPSYVSPALQELHEEAQSKNVLVLNEMGVDPGIDHMSAMEIIHRLKNEGASILSFESYTGGLVAPKSDTNLWGYKISWNPRNVVMAGSGGLAQYRENSKVRYIPYSRVFEDITEVVASDGVTYDAYANRNSLQYLSLYGLDTVQTLIRGTLRKKGFCEAWTVLVNAGFTNDDTVLTSGLVNTWEELSESVLGAKRLAAWKKGEGLSSSQHAKLEELGLWSSIPLQKKDATLAVHLQDLLERQWVLQPGDADLIVMVHRFIYEINGVRRQLMSSLVLEGENDVYTAMSKTVGMPIAFGAVRLLRGQFSSKGVHIPISPEFYSPLLEDLRQTGIRFEESITEI